MRKTAVVIACLLLAACTDPETAKRAAENVGLTNVQAGGYSLFGCSDNDTFRTKFSATNAQGRAVSGVVCSGWLKSATVRFN